MSASPLDPAPPPLNQGLRLLWQRADPARIESPPPDGVRVVGAFRFRRRVRRFDPFAQPAAAGLPSLAELLAGSGR